jgi:predicted short-subunit dehydrogenase-like oxidoreductase (DUF2520 family)
MPTTPVNRPTLAIIGAGRVGSTLAQTLRWRGYHITSVYSRTPESAHILAEKLGSPVAENVTDAALSANLTFLTVPDDMIQVVCEMLAYETDLTGRAVVHTSGVSGVLVLESAKAHGAWVGGLHPMMSIMDREISPRITFSVPWVANSPDVTFGVEASDEPLHTWLADIVHALNGIPLWLRPGQDRARYHAAGVIASNYAVTLFAEAMRLLQVFQGDSEGDERALQRILVHLVESTLSNLKEVGPVQALTGPIVRGDAGTVRKHLAALTQADPELAELYRLLGRRTLRLAAERGLPPHKIEGIRKSLEEADADNDSQHPENEG